MVASQAEIKSRIEELRLSHSGYTRQLGRPGLSRDRQERLEIDVGLLQEEIATLDKILSLSRIEPDHTKVQAAVQERLDVLAARYAEDPALAHLEPDELGAASGEARALLWALGRDRLTIAMHEIIKSHGPRDTGRTERAIPNILKHALEEGPDPDTRASSAYELGKLHIQEAIPSLVAALNDPDSFVGQVALRALAYFSDEELAKAQVVGGVLRQVSAARTALAKDEG